MATTPSVSSHIDPEGSRQGLVFQYKVSLSSHAYQIWSPSTMGDMPRIWSQTIEAHRDAVREAAINATAALVARHGLTGVTMSQIAKDTGVGRATLYKYFPDVESILRAWHERQIDHHLKELLQVRDRTTGAAERLQAVLTAYGTALSHRRAHDDDMAGMLHGGEHGAAAHQHLREFIRELIADAAAAGAVRQ